MNLYSVLLAVSIAGAEQVPPGAPLKFSGLTLVDTGGRVEIQVPGMPEHQAPGKLPMPLGVGATLRTGALSKALVEHEDGGVVSLSAHSLVEISNPACRLAEGRLRAVAPPRQIVAVETAGVAVRVDGRTFSIEVHGKGKGKMAALGNGRAIAAKLVAAKGFVEIQLPFGTVRASELPLTLHEGSVVQTAANSFALIIFPDGSRMKLRADSTAVVDGETTSTLAAGAADIQVSAKGRLELRTVDSPALIRGPAFVVEVQKGQAVEPGALEPPELLKALKAEATLPGGMGWDEGGN